MLNILSILGHFRILKVFQFKCHSFNYFGHFSMLNIIQFHIIFQEFKKWVALEENLKEKNKKNEENEPGIEGSIIFLGKAERNQSFAES